MGGPGSCHVCQRTDHKTLDSRAAAGESIRALARECKVPESTLRTHLKRCRRPGRPAPRPAATPASPAELEMPEVPVGLSAELSATLEELKRHHDRLAVEYVKALGLDEHGAQVDGAGDPRLVPQLMLQLRQNLLARQRLIEKSPAAKSPIDRLVDNPEWISARQILAVSLEPFPEARLAVIKGLRTWLAEPGEAN